MTTPKADGAAPVGGQRCACPDVGWVFDCPKHRGEEIRTLVADHARLRGQLAAVTAERDRLKALGQDAETRDQPPAVLSTSGVVPAAADTGRCEVCGREIGTKDAPLPNKCWARGAAAECAKSILIIERALDCARWALKNARANATAAQAEAEALRKERDDAQALAASYEEARQHVAAAQECSTDRETLRTALEACVAALAEALRIEDMICGATEQRLRAALAQARAALKESSGG